MLITATTTALSNPQAPRTMTLGGLQFLQSLAEQRTSGCYLEIGPLFGSSTCAIDKGRVDSNVPIHTIDTFDPAPWVRKRFGKDLSREEFHRYTGHIRGLHVHQGFSPHVVADDWAAPIGFYFDDATHGDPGWSDNFAFFSRFFTDDAIICGDDFAGGWPDIVRNVYRIADEWDLRLFVIGRVWAFTRKNDARISEAIHQIHPALRDVMVGTVHDTGARENVAASWSWGLHLPQPLINANLLGADRLECAFHITYRTGEERHVRFGPDPVSLQNAQSITVSLPRQISVQFCVLQEGGKTENTRDLRNGSTLVLPPGAAVTALRLSQR